LKFDFKEFSVTQARSALKVGTDAMLLGAMAQHPNPKTILDIGTGTGVLSLMLAQKYPNAKIHAIDIDAESLLDCQENFEKSPWKENLSLTHIDFNRFETTTKFDLIISNPPFYENGLKGENNRINLAKHEDDNLIEQLFVKSKDLLTNSGVLWLILPYSSSQHWIDFAQKNGFNLVENHTVFAKTDRPKRSVLWFGVEASESLKLSELIVRTDSGGYTREYKMLTKSFHSKEL
jgi:tRNA1Val (adenine37-N6)-methyltransferase